MKTSSVRPHAGETLPWQWAAGPGATNPARASQSVRGWAARRAGSLHSALPRPSAGAQGAPTSWPGGLAMMSALFCSETLKVRRSRLLMPSMQPVRSRSSMRCISGTSCTWRGRRDCQAGAAVTTKRGLAPGGGEALGLLSPTHLDQTLHPQRPRRLGQVLQVGVGKHGGDEQHGVRPMRPCLEDLVGLRGGEWQGSGHVHEVRCTACSARTGAEDASGAARYVACPSPSQAGKAFGVGERRSPPAACPKVAGRGRAGSFSSPRSRSNTLRTGVTHDAPPR